MNDSLTETQTSVGDKSSVFVTLADANYVDQARQLFASVYFNAGWSGDYLLLAHDIPEEDLAWFERRGILVQRCRPLFQGDPGGMPAVLTSKFYLLDEGFKRWNTIVYCDADAMVRASLSELVGRKGFWAVTDSSRWIGSQIVTREAARRRGLDPKTRRRLVQEVRAIRRLDEPCFSAGFFVFGSDLIGEKTTGDLVEWQKRYGVISRFGEQLIWNLMFGHVWKELSPIYNFQIRDRVNRWNVPPDQVTAIVLHFISRDKPWTSFNEFYEEWSSNLDRSDDIDLEHVPHGRTWSAHEIDAVTESLNGLDVASTYWRRRIRLVTPAWLKPVYKPFSRGRRAS